MNFYYFIEFLKFLKRQKKNLYILVEGDLEVSALGMAKFSLALFLIERLSDTYQESIDIVPSPSESILKIGKYIYIAHANNNWISR